MRVRACLRVCVCAILTDVFALNRMTFDMQYHVGKEHVFEGIQPFRKISQPVMIHKRLLKMNYPEPPRSPPPLKGPKVFY